MTGAVLLPTLLALALSTVVAAAILGGLPGSRRERTPQSVAALTALLVTVVSVAAITATSADVHDDLVGPLPAAPSSAGPTQPGDRVVPTAVPAAPRSETRGAGPARPLRVRPVRRTTTVLSAAPVLRRPVAPVAPARPAAPTPPRTTTKTSVAAPVNAARAPDGPAHPVTTSDVVALPRAQSSSPTAPSDRPATNDPTTTTAPSGQDEPTSRDQPDPRTSDRDGSDYSGVCTEPTSRTVSPAETPHRGK